MAVQVKICGVSTSEALDATIAAGAEYVGFNFYAPSPRSLTPVAAATLADRAGARIAKVGVFVDPDDRLLGESIAAGRLDAVQLHGEEAPERTATVRRQFGLPVWKVLPVTTADDVARAASYRDVADFLLFDAKTPKGSALPGGMGLIFDWSLLRAYRGPTPWGLAGGLTPANAAEAIAATGAPLLDTSSGVESAPGVKDVDLIRAFCKAARSAG